MTFEVVFWDVQHGSATYIKTPNQTHIVQDLGIGSLRSKDMYFSPLRHLKYNYGVEQLDYVIISHPHKDHISDIMNFDELSPKVLCRPKHITTDDIMKDVLEEDRELYEKYLEINDRYCAPVSVDENPKLPKNNGGVELETFHPRECSKDNLNNHSIVSVVKYAESKMVLSGDNESPSWNELMDMNGFIESVENSDILLAPHHGRESGFDSDVMSIINPRLTIVSDGPYVDTSATDLYSQISRGWTVHKRSGGDENRYCVTTRKDGVIVVKFGYNRAKKPFIDVRID